MYQKILIPLENSAADETILSHIKSLARLTGAELVLIHVADGHVARNQQQLNLADSEEMRQDRAYLDKRREALVADGFEARAQLAGGDPATEIVALAEAEKFDLIAMATHGHGLVKDIVLGTVANAVRHRTDIPVLLVRAPAP